MASLRRRILIYLAALAIPLGLGVLVPITLIQVLLNRSLLVYERNQQYQVVDELVHGLEERLREYLEARSTDSLRGYLDNYQQLQDSVALFSPSPNDKQLVNQERYLERSVHFLILSLQETADHAVQAKRGRSPEQYTQLYSEVRAISSLLRSELIELSQKELTRVMQVQESFSHQFTWVRLFSFLFLTSLIFLTAVLAAMFAGKIAEPISRLSASALRVADGDFAVPDIPLHGSTEVRHMADAFNRMKESIRRYIKEMQRTAGIEKGLMEERVANLKMKNRIKQAEMIALQNQIRPHFLFNALNTGVQLSTIEQAERTSEYLDSLASLFRESLRPLSEVSTLEREYGTLCSFLYIMQIRFGTRVELRHEFASNTVATPLPRLVLQPLVENSILHGFQNGEGNILLRSGYDGTRVLIELHDDGVGMSPELVKQISYEASTWDSELPEPDSRTVGSGSGIALRNVMYRMRLFCGTDDCFKIDSQPGTGVRVRLLVPDSGGIQAREQE
ncbi:MAG: HAMP domain-containing protein [Spirochaetaceae bacterium]|nr:MAG: HAMP domain-containing protein [Spirochaetaceae bacterium]